MTIADSDTFYDTIIIGSGFGGAMVAHELVHAGERVLMLERGGWVTRGPGNWAPHGVGLLSSHYTTETPYSVTTARKRYTAGSFACVGGQSVFYGGASLRFRAEDFEADDDIVADSEAEWPYRYAQLEPYYARAEALLGIAGESGVDPTEPPRSTPFPFEPGPLSSASKAIATAARGLGLTPFRLPLAINYVGRNGSDSVGRCVACTSCDGYACAVEAKNDVATRVLPPLLAAGMHLRPSTVAVRLQTGGGRVASVQCVDRETGATLHFRARRFVLSAGALASPHLLLASRLERMNPGGRTVGRYLMRHCNAVVLGVFPWRPNPDARFDKQFAIHDYYFGHPSITSPRGKLGGIQQLTPPAGLVRAYLPRPLGAALAPGVAFTSGLIVIAEDQPREENGVSLDGSRADAFGLPHLRVQHRYSVRDLAAARALVGRARALLSAAGAVWSYRHSIETFSHAVGTVRMGTDERTSALDEFCRFRGIDNLHVVDASFMPRSAGVNPSLTIAGNALRVGAHLARNRVSAVAFARGSLAVPR